MTTSAGSDGIYRTPGRAPEPERVPAPSLRLLLSPLASAACVVSVIAVPVLLFDAIRVAVLESSADTRFVPAVALTLDLLALTLLASPVWLGLIIAGRVAPYWSSLRRWSKVSYVTALFALELLVLVTAQASIMARRTGMHLFEPTLQHTSLAPDGRRAHVYRGGLVQCRYDVYVAAPFALTMKRELSATEHGCLSPAPHVRWSADHSIQLLDHDGEAIVPSVVMRHHP